MGLPRPNGMTDCRIRYYAKTRGTAPNEISKNSALIESTGPAGHFQSEPRAGISPVVFGACDGDAQGLGCLGRRQGGKKAELDELGFAGMALPQLLQSLVEAEEIVA